MESATFRELLTRNKIVYINFSILQYNVTSQEIKFYFLSVYNKSSTDTIAYIIINCRYNLIIISWLRYD